MNLESLRKLWVHELKDLYSAENQIIEALPRMIKAADNEDLKTGLSAHLEQTRAQARRLETIFKTLEFSPGGHHCVGMEGLLKEAKESMDSVTDPQVRDAAIIASAQRVEHYEIAGYGTAGAFAEQLGERQAAELLQLTLDEEAAADTKLSRIARRSVNFEAMVAAR